MCKRNIYKALIIFLYLSIFVIINCISVPKNPKSEEEKCIANFYHNKRKIREIQVDNRNFTTAVVWVSLGTGFIFGYPGLLPLGILPFTQYKNYKKSEQIIENYEILHCNKNFE